MPASDPNRTYTRYENAEPDESMESQTLLAHLNELRKMLMIIAAAVGAAFVLLLFCFGERLLDLVVAPIREMGIQVVFTDMAEAFAAQAKLSLLAAVILVSPVIFFAVWWFVRPALSKKERRQALIYLGIAVLLFVTGVLFAYRFVFFLAVNFFVSAGSGVAMPMMTIGKYISFLFGFLVPFGVMFELPVVVVWLTKLGFIDADTLRKGRRFFIVGIFVAAAILTPPDVVSQIMLAVPLLGLFEVSVICAKVVERRSLSDKAPLEKVSAVK